MSETSDRICPQCGFPVPQDSRFCENCGATLPEPVAERPEEPSSPEVSEHPFENPRPDSVRTESSAANDRMVPMPDPPTVSPMDAPTVRGGFGDLPRPVAPVEPPRFAGHAAPEAEELPFSIEWDDARAFMEKHENAFALRFKAECDIEKLGVGIFVNGEPVGKPEVKSNVRKWDRFECPFPFCPAQVGAFVVQIRVEIIQPSGAHEMFEPVESIVHTTFPERGKVVNFNGSINVRVDQSGNSGIIRNDNARVLLDGLETENVDVRLQRILGSRGNFRKIGFSSTRIKHESVRLMGFGQELTIVRGTPCITFGRSRHADVCLEAEKPDGSRDDVGKMISGRHCTVRYDRACGSFALRDGGPLEDGSGWKNSSNGTLFGDVTLTMNLGQNLLPGRSMPVCLAPHVRPGGALSLGFHAVEPSFDFACDHMGNIDALIVRRKDNPAKTVLIVWGCVSLDEVLGSKTGFRIACRRERLHLVKPDGSSSRLLFLSGQNLAGFHIQ